MNLLIVLTAMGVIGVIGSIEYVEAIADFVTDDPQTYIDRYNNEPSFKEWFDKHYVQYDSIYEAVGLPNPNKPIVTPTPTNQTNHIITLQEGHHYQSCVRVPNGCFSPENITIQLGDSITFVNPTDESSYFGINDIINQYSFNYQDRNSSLTWTPSTIGEHIFRHMYSRNGMVYHGGTPFGNINVYGTEPTIPKIPLVNNTANYTLSDGSILNISISEPQIHKAIKIELNHKNYHFSNNTHANSINYRVSILQNEQVVFKIDKEGRGGTISVTTQHITSTDPLEIHVTNQKVFEVYGHIRHKTYSMAEKIIFTTNSNPVSDPPRTIPNPLNTNEEKDRQIIELSNQIHILRQQLLEKDVIMSDQREEIQEQQKKIDKQRKNINNKKGVIEEKNSDSDRLLYLESTMKMLIDYFNITSPIKNTPDTNTTDSQLQTKFNTLQSRYNTLEANYNSTVSELSDLRSRFNTIESLYNFTIDDNNEKQHTIDKLTQELNVATKRIEELESRDSQFQGSSSDESLNDDETNNDETNTQSDEPVEPIEPVEIPTISITLPDSMSLDNTDRTIDLYTYGTNNIRIDTYYPDTGTKYHINDKADITIYRDTEITNRQFIATNQDSYCYVGDLVVGLDPSIPISVQHTNSLQLQFRESDDPTRCDQAPNILFNDKLSLNKEIYVRFVGTDGQIPFYYTNEIVEIPKCTTDKFDDNTDTLLNNTEICYAKSGSDTVIVSKILVVFGISNDLS